MEWINIFGLVFMTLVMIPNILFVIRCKEGFANRWHNRFVELTEQIGRFGCFGFMVFNIPGTFFGWWSEEAFAVYLIADGFLVLLYCLLWLFLWKKNNLFRALSLSVIPSVLFLFSGVMSRSILLTLSALLFAPCHILISYKNTA
ncbi:MAG: hypothetical protein IJA48_08290 [Oscillospiraceae bacterium]|nr:hypothetical protein [Oscillospiraceae bacterium]